MVNGHIKIIGGPIVVDEEGEQFTFNNAMLVVFDSQEDVREAMMSGEAKLIFGEEKNENQ